MAIPRSARAAASATVIARPAPNDPPDPPSAATACVVGRSSPVPSSPVLAGNPLLTSSVRSSSAAGQYPGIDRPKHCAAPGGVRTCSPPGASGYSVWMYRTALPFQQRIRTVARYAVPSSASGVRLPPRFGTSHLGWNAPDRWTKTNASSPLRRMGSASPGPRIATRACSSSPFDSAGHGSTNRAAAAIVVTSRIRRMRAPPGVMLPLHRGLGKGSLPPRPSGRAVRPPPFTDGGDVALSVEHLGGSSTNRERHGRYYPRLGRPVVQG